MERNTNRKEETMRLRGGRYTVSPTGDGQWTVYNPGGREVKTVAEEWIAQALAAAANREKGKA